MDNELDNIQELMEDAARRVLDERHPASLAGQSAADPAWHAELWRELAALGWPGVLLPEAAGGLGQGLGVALPIAVQAGRHLLTAPLIANMALLPRLAAACNRDGRVMAWLAPMLAGDTSYALATWRPDGRLQAEHASTDRQALAWRRDDAGALRLELHEMRDASCGMGLDPAIPMASLPGGEAADAVDLHIDEADFTRWQQGYRLLRAAEMLGAAQAALDAAAAYARERQQFGRAIGANQAVKHRLADDWMALDDATLAGKEAARLLDDPDGPAAAHACAVAELLALESAQRAAQNAIQVHGALGIAWDSGVHLYLKRVVHLASMLGGGRRRTELLESLWRDGGAPSAAA